MTHSYVTYTGAVGNRYTFQAWKDEAKTSPWNLTTEVSSIEIVFVKPRNRGSLELKTGVVTTLNGNDFHWDDPGSALNLSGYWGVSPFLVLPDGKKVPLGTVSIPVGHSPSPLESEVSELEQDIINLKQGTESERVAALDKLAPELATDRVLLVPMIDNTSHELGKHISKDYSTIPHHGLVHASKYVKVGNGSDVHVDVGVHSELQITGDLHIGFVYMPITQVDNDGLVTCTPDGGGTEIDSDNTLYRIAQAAGKHIDVFHESAGAVNNVVEFNFDFELYHEYFVEVIRDSVLKNYYLYVDGDLKDTQAYANDPVGGTTGTVHIFHDQNTNPPTGRHVNAVMYDVMICSSIQTRSVMDKARKEGDFSEVVDNQLLLRLDEPPNTTDDTTVLDASPNHFDGTVSGTLTNFTQKGRISREDFPTEFKPGFISPDVDAHQGYTTDGTNHYVFDNAKIRKYDANWTLLLENTDPYNGLPAGFASMSDGHYLDGKLYTKVFNVVPTTLERLAIYNADTLLLESSVDTFDASRDPVGSFVSKDEGATGIWHTVTSVVTPSKILNYDLATRAFIDSHDVKPAWPADHPQGMTRKGDKYYITHDDGNDIWECDLDGRNARKVHDIAAPGSNHEGCDFSQAEYRTVIDNGDGDRKVHYFDVDTRTSHYTGDPALTKGLEIKDTDSDHVRIPYFLETSADRTEMSVFGVVSGDSVGSNFTIFGRYFSGIGNRCWRISKGDTDPTKLYVAVSEDGTFSASTVSDIESTITVFDGLDHVVGFTFENGTVELWIDGVKDTSAVQINSGAATVYDGAVPITIGGSIPTSGIGVNGTNSKPRWLTIYNTKVTDEIAQKIYHMYKPLLSIA